MRGYTGNLSEGERHMKQRGITSQLNGPGRRTDARGRSIAALLVSAAFCLSMAAAAEAGRQGRESKLAQIQQRITAVVEKASPAIVRIVWEPTGRGGGMNGVIVTADGYVVTRGQHGLPAGKAVRLYLRDGRRVTARVLGSSWSWDIGMVKIADNGLWPHVQLGRSADARPGDVCVALGYPDPFQVDERDPSPRVGRILTSVASWWLCSSCQLHWGDCGGGLFDLDGRLIGIHLSRDVDKTLHPAIELVEKHWKDLVTGKQIDDLIPADFSKATAESSRETAAERESAASDERLAKGVAKARSATVRVAWAEKERDRVSGVIVTADGYVATCAHHDRTPGEAITVYLADGRAVAGKVLGSIPFCDIGLMKITEKGPWPHAEFGNSLTMKRGDLIILVGYPFAPIDEGMLEAQRNPAVRLGLVVEGISRGPGVLSTSCFNLSGDSGGGVFDLKGRLVAIHYGAENYDGPAYHSRIELLRKQWDFLTAGKPLDSLPSNRVDTVTEAELEQLRAK